MNAARHLSYTSVEHAIGDGESVVSLDVQNTLAGHALQVTDATAKPIIGGDSDHRASVSINTRSLRTRRF